MVYEVVVVELETAVICFYSLHVAFKLVAGYQASAGVGYVNSNGISDYEVLCDGGVEASDSYSNVVAVRALVSLLAKELPVTT